MNERALLRLADLNMAEFWSESAKWIPDTEVIESDGTVFINSGIDFPGCSAVINLSEGADENPADFIARSKAFFSGKKKGFSLLLRGHCDQHIIQHCKDQKVFLVADEPGMVLDAKATGGAPPEAAVLRWVDSQMQLQSYREVVAEAFTDLLFPREMSEAYFADARRVLNPFSVMAVIYLGGQPASAAMAMLSHGIAGVYWVGTSKEARGKGLAQYCVREVSNAAFDMGARKVVLHASKFGAPVYPKIGYREFSNYPHFICSSK
ncbi:MAG: GNAT family N-acetyltransferase [Dehalococcoidia bacterium]|nr:MAG: GNAT family N-acetyltransferase [Dehalococcoidia bacterium]